MTIMTTVTQAKELSAKMLAETEATRRVGLDASSITTSSFVKIGKYYVRLEERKCLHGFLGSPTSLKECPGPPHFNVSLGKNSINNVTNGLIFILECEELIEQDLLDAKGCVYYNCASGGKLVRRPIKNVQADS